MSFLAVHNLEKTYFNEGIATPALRGVTLEVAKGEFLAIMGPSGSGKSTLLHILGFLDRPTGGRYLFGGKDMESYGDDELAVVRNKKIGFVFQTFNLLARTNVLENVKLPLLYSGINEKHWDDHAKKAIDAVGLSHRLGHLPSQLSGGERQRVAIARALVLNPEVIFADEPTGNLDSKSGQIIMSILQHLNEIEHHTIILITHETYTAEHASRIVHLLDGQLERDEKVRARRQSDHFIK